MKTSDVTLVANAIHNPAEPRHFMRLKPIQRRVRVKYDDIILAESTNAIRLLEAGRDLYDPVIYLPRTDVSASLIKTSRSSHCPLKGEAEYFNLVDKDGKALVSEIAWSYADPLEFATDLTELIAFYSNHVSVEEMPL